MKEGKIERGEGEGRVERRQEAKKTKKDDDKHGHMEEVNKYGRRLQGKKCEKS